MASEQEGEDEAALSASSSRKRGRSRSREPAYRRRRAQSSSSESRAEDGIAYHNRPDGTRLLEVNTSRSTPLERQRFNQTLDADTADDFDSSAPTILSAMRQAKHFGGLARKPEQH